MTEFEANISVGDGQAYYQILEDGSGLYNAKLLSYTGTSDKLDGFIADAARTVVMRSVQPGTTPVVVALGFVVWLPAKARV